MAAVLVHGRDLDPEFMLEAAQRVGLDDQVAYVLPRASGRSWYPGRFYDPMEDNEPWLGWSLEAIEPAVAAARGNGRALPAIALVGFSQGACIVAEHLARRPAPYGAAAILTGALFGTPDAERMPAGSLGELPMFFGIAEGDDWIPVDAVRDTVCGLPARRRALRAACLRRPGARDQRRRDRRRPFLLTDLLERSA